MSRCCCSASAAHARSAAIRSLYEVLASATSSSSAGLGQCDTSAEGATKHASIRPGALGRLAQARSRGAARDAKEG